MRVCVCEYAGCAYVACVYVDDFGWCGLFLHMLAKKDVAFGERLQSVYQHLLGAAFNISSLSKGSTLVNLLRIANLLAACCVTGHCIPLPSSVRTYRCAFFDFL